MRDFSGRSLQPIAVIVILIYLQQWYDAVFTLWRIRMCARLKSTFSLLQEIPSFRIIFGSNHVCDSYLLQAVCLLPQTPDIVVLVTILTCSHCSDVVTEGVW